METKGIDWARIGQQLAAPFPPAEVEWRPQGKGGKNARAQVVPYLDARAVQERIDTVCGVGGWSFELEPIVVDAGELRVARGRLTILGVTRDDIGTASNWEPSKGAASDALKRAAVMFGIGRYLHRLPAVWVTLDVEGKIAEATLAKLREGLQRHATAA